MNGLPMISSEQPGFMKIFMNFMDRAGIKEEFNAYLRNAGLEDYEAHKCPQYHDLTSSFVRRFEYSSSRNSPFSHV